MKFVLRLKHWQLFLLVCGVPFALYISIFASMFATMFATIGQTEPDPIPTFPGFAIGFGLLFAASWLTAIVVMTSWMFQVATGLYERRPADSQLKIKRFYFAFFFPMVYIGLMMLGGLSVALYVTSVGKISEPDPSSFFMLFLVIIPLHLFSMVCFLYVIYFVGKALKSVELGREAVAGEYISECVLVWMFFVGIWFIQPKINKIFGDETISISPS